MITYLNKEKDKQNIYILISFMIFACLSTIILLFMGILHGEDIIFNVKRIIEVRENVAHFHFISLYSLNTDHGAAVLGMYPSFNLLPICILSLLGISIRKSILIMFFINVLITLIISFYSSLHFSKSYLVSYLFSILYSTSYIFLIHNFLTMDMGVVSTYVVLPLIIFGFVDILQGSKNYFKLSVGLIIVLLSHLPSFLVILICLFLWMVINLKHINKIILVTLIKVAIMTVFFTSVFWIPFIYIIINNKINTPQAVQLSGLSLKSLFLNISVLALFSLIISLMFFKYFNKYLKQFYLLSLFFILLSSKLIPYKIITSFYLFKNINKLQFTSRFLIIPQLLLLFLLSKSLVIFIKLKLKNNHQCITALATIIFLLLSGSILCQLCVVHEYPQVTTLTSKVHSPQPHGKGLKITTNKSINYLKNFSLPLFSQGDYLPKETKPRVRLLNRSNGFYIIANREHTVNVPNIGFNKYEFIKNNGMHNVHLPIIKYNKEHMKIYLNKHIVSYNIDKYKFIMINVSHEKKGTHNIVRIEIK